MKRVETIGYLAGWCIAAILAAVILTEKITGLSVFELIPPCLFHAVTGLYCPGCGGTRALRSLLQGRLLQSFLYHPLILYGAVTGGWFMISQTIERLSGGRWPIGMRVRGIYLWIALGILIVNVLIKNLFLLCA